MKRFGKWIAIAAVVVVVIFIFLLILAKILITPEKVRETVLPLAKEALHRDVSLGEIDVSLFSGITLKDLAIADREGTEPFVAADRVVLRYRLWPLLFLRVEVDEVSLDTPKVRVVRHADGSFNFSDLTGGEKKAVSEIPKEPRKSEPSSPPIAIHVSEVAVTNGDVVFLDHTLRDKEPYRYTVQGIDLRATEISLDRSFPFSLHASINGAPLAVEGEADPKNAGGSVKLTLSGFDVVPFTPYFREAIPGKLASLKVDLDLKAGGNADAAFSEGNIRLREIDLTLDAMKDAPLHGMTLAIDHDLKVDLVKSVLDISALTVTFNGLPLHLKGRVVDFAASPRLDLEARLDGLDLEKVIPALPSALTTSVKDLAPSGALDAVVRLSGPADKLVVDAAVSSERLVVDVLTPSSTSSDSSAKSVHEKKIPASDEIGPFDIPATATAKVSIRRALYNGLGVDGLELLCSLEKNIFTLKKLTGNIAGGSFSKTATVDLAKKGLAYKARLDVEKVQADPVVTAFMPKASGTVFGTLDLHADLSGRGTLPDTVKKSLTGTGNLLIVDGKLTGAGLVKGLADFLDMEELRVLQFSKLAGDFTIRDGRVLFATNVAGRDARLAPEGTIGLDGSLDVGLDLRLSPELSAKLDRKGTVSNYFKDEQGWGQIPLKLKGTASSPRFSLDTAALGKKVKEKAKEEIRKTIEKKLFDKITPDKEGVNKQNLEDTLKGLFGR